MDRFVLLALLGIPVLVIIHVALFGQPTPPGVAMVSATFSGGGQNHRVLQGLWSPSE
jgi:hypothetical protein